MMKRFLHPAWRLLAWHLLFPLLLQAQYHLTKTYTVQDGLPFTEISNCLASKAGHLYLITTTGRRLVFDGFTFHEFGEGEVARDLTVSRQIFEDKHGVWMLVGDNLYLCNGFSEEEIAAPQIRNHFLDENENRLALIGPENHWWAFSPENRRFERGAVTATGKLALDKGFQYGVIAKFGKYWEILARPYSTEKFVLESDTGFTGRKELHFPKGAGYLYPLSTEAFLVEMHEDPDNLTETKNYIYRSGQATPQEGKDWMGRRRQFPNYRSYPFRGKVLMYGRPAAGNARSGDDMEIWEVMPSGEAVFHARFRLSADLSTIKVQMDAAGNFWLPSQGGLVKVFPAFLGCFDSNPNMASGLHTINEDPQGDIWFGFYRHGFSKFDGDKVSRVPPPPSLPILHLMPGAWKDEEGDMYYFNESYNGFFKANGREWKSIVLEEPMTGGYFHPLSNGKQMALGLYKRRGLGLMDYPFEPGRPMRFIDSLQGMRLVNVQTISEDRSHRLWLGKFGQGISLYDPRADTAVTWEIQDKRGIEAISSLIDSRGNLWLGTSIGLAFLPNPEGFDYLHQNINDHARRLALPEAGGGIVTFLKEYRGFLFFGDNKGFGLLNLDTYYANPENPRVHYFNTTNYLPGGSSEQNAVLIESKGHIWMGNDQGAIRLDPDRLVLDTGALRLDTLYFLHGRNERSEAAGGRLELPRGQRNLAFHWRSSFDKQLAPNRWLSYRLILASGDTLQQSDYLLEQTTSLGYIPPGEHRLEFILYKDNQVQERRAIQLIILKNLEDSWWFWALISGFVLLAGGSILWLVYTKKRQQQRYELAAERLRREKEELQVQAITSSLNPHFLNNTLHWVQAKVRRDDVASTLIDRLAQNIRLVFQRSRNGEAFHSLLEEMTLVRNYLSIQNRRFNERYQFILPTEEEVMLYRHIMVPLMQVLIHAENAVEWGLRNRKGSSFLRIALKDEGPYLKIIIEDDGIGYSNAIEKNIGGTRQGERMLNALHEIFNPRNMRKIISDIEDNIYIDPQSGLQFGTRISILIPKLFNYGLETDKGRSSRR